MSKNLLQALSVDRGIVCVLGAGGKKSTILALAAAYSGKLGISSTVYIPPFKPQLRARAVIAPISTLQTEVMLVATRQTRIAYAVEADKANRHGGVPADLITTIHQDGGFDLTLVKADGARGRLIKAPSAREPVIPEQADLVLAVVSIQACGRPLTEKYAHHVDELVAITQCPRDALMQPKHLAKALVHLEGALKNCGNKKVIPIINMVDDQVWRERAVMVAEQVLKTSERFDRVILATMNKPEPLVGVIT